MKKKISSREREQFYHREPWAIHRALKGYLMFEPEQNIRIGQKNRGSQILVYIRNILVFVKNADIWALSWIFWSRKSGVVSENLHLTKHPLLPWWSQGVDCIMRHVSLKSGFWSVVSRRVSPLSSPGNLLEMSILGHTQEWQKRWGL